MLGRVSAKERASVCSRQKAIPPGAGQKKPHVSVLCSALGPIHQNLLSSPELRIRWPDLHPSVPHGNCSGHQRPAGCNHRRYFLVKTTIYAKGKNVCWHPSPEKTKKSQIEREIGCRKLLHF